MEGNDDGEKGGKVGWDRLACSLHILSQPIS